jgi:hypothetical protein
MLSTIIFCEDQPANPGNRSLAELLARTLASLIPAKVEGVLGDVRIAGPAGKDLSILANHAGCGLIEADGEARWLGLAVKAARGPDILLFRCGHAPEAGFIEEASDYLVRDPKDRARAACLRAAPESFFQRLFPGLAPIAGLIASRNLLLQAPPGSFSTLAAFAAPATSFHTRARRIR